ncbi:MAG: tRNA pseudouridine(55) synthase TruB [Planctomycetes bacterium]|nr:tRNA pseudouridine(55) synthase TruB [Planctomycetota bacterium]
MTTESPDPDRTGDAGSLCAPAATTTDSAVPFPETLAAFRENPLGLLGRIPGVWLVDKPSGPSSNLAVVRARKRLGLKRVGHAGTLDPLASGLLLLLAGNATRLFDHMQEFTKTYTAGFRLGVRTDSQDITGVPVPDHVPSRRPPLDRDEIVAALAPFRGTISQVPPMHSALKQDGQPLYRLARKGIVVPREAREVTVHCLELVEFDGTDGVVRMEASKGFYVRTLIDALGVRLGTGAVMTTLRREAIGPFRLDGNMAGGDETGILRDLF